MAHTQPIPEGTSKCPRYKSLLGERIYLGRQLADQLSHLQEMTPLGRRLFQRLLRVDAKLSRFVQYDVDQPRLVTKAEDDRMHQPPDLPPDHDWSPCPLCASIHGSVGHRGLPLSAGGAR